MNRDLLKSDGIEPTKFLKGVTSIFSHSDHSLSLSFLSVEYCLDVGNYLAKGIIQRSLIVLRSEHMGGHSSNCKLRD